MSDRKKIDFEQAFGRHPDCRREGVNAELFLTFRRKPPQEKFGHPCFKASLYFISMFHFELKWGIAQGARLGP
jgi:hypothetical protein